MGRGRSQASITLIEAAAVVVEQCRPITVRGIAYKLFTQGITKSMEVSEYRKVSRLVLDAREEGLIPWEDVVDDGRPTQNPSTFSSPRSFAEAVKSSWRADPWQEQGQRVEIISEKATVAGVLGPVLRELALPFRAYKGFTSGTAAWNLADDSVGDARPLVCLYLGDHDPSGRYMSDVDLPERVERYGGEAELIRIALTEADLPGLPGPGFDVSTKSGDPRAPWFRKRFGSRCYELDALDPEGLRQRVRDRVSEYIDPGAWERVETANQAVRDSLSMVMKGWSTKATGIFERVQEC